MPDPLQLARSFNDALNKRDQNGFLALLTDDVEFHNPLGPSATGHEAAKQFLASSTHLGAYVEPDGPAQVDGNHVAMPVLLRMGDGTELRPAGVFDIRDDKIARFAVVMDRRAAGL